jgi:hypothetical protein
MDLYVQNNCAQSINVHVSAGRFSAESRDFSVEIAPYSEELIYQCKDIFELERKDIPHYIQELNILNGNDTLEINILDTCKWGFEILTLYKPLKSTYHSKATISINPENFE